MAALFETEIFGNSNHGFPWTPERRYDLDPLIFEATPEVRQLTDRLLGNPEPGLPLGEKIKVGLEYLTRYIPPLALQMRW